MQTPPIHATLVDLPASSRDSICELLLRITAMRDKIVIHAFSSLSDWLQSPPPTHHAISKQVLFFSTQAAAGIQLSFYPTEISRLGASLISIDNGISSGTTGPYGDQGSNIALKNSNDSGIYTQMSGGGGNRGNTITVVQTPSEGIINVGAANKLDASTFSVHSGSGDKDSKVKVIRITWREIL